MRFVETTNTFHKHRFGLVKLRGGGGLPSNDL